MALPVDPRIEALLSGGRGLVATGNAQRQQASILAALGLTESGLLERSGSVLQGSANAGFAEAPDLLNQTWGVQRGPEGRAFRQTQGQIDASAAQRGAAYSSGRDNAQAAGRTALLQQLAGSIRGYDGAQAQSIMGQMQPLGELGRSIAEIRFEQGREAAATPAVPGPSEAFQAAMTPATGAPGISAMPMKKATKGPARQPLKRAPVVKVRR